MSSDGVSPFLAAHENKKDFTSIVRDLEIDIEYYLAH